MAEAAMQWVRDYALLALRINRLAGEASAFPLLDYRGPHEWRAQVEAERPPSADRLVAAAEQLSGAYPFAADRAAYLAAQVRSMRAVASRLRGDDIPLRDYATRCLGLEIDWLPESEFDAAHAQLDAALPNGPGTLAERLGSWKHAHHLRQPDRLPTVVASAIAETRARTQEFVPLPEEIVDCQLVSGVSFRGAGLHHGGVRSTILVNRDLPFNLADLLALVAHEGHPGHIAEQVLKERHLVRDQGLGEARIKFLLSPQFALSEGLGQCAQELLFPGDLAQRWLTDNIFPDHEIRSDGSDFAAIHEAQNILWGVWGNAAFLAAAGRPFDEIADYLARWALLGDTEIAAARPLVVEANPYLFGYYHGWRHVRAWLDHPDRTRRLRRLLTEQLAPAALTGN
ncbi:hypothetical protein [Nocardia australiensis]|uniref:hypothetical protein n=1 Tax=Nocardia australiensis TaxID=2887191 RepID=UPI001D1475A0|nr:hypothetical protein [Nocardia australiensis]